MARRPRPAYRKPSEQWELTKPTVYKLIGWLFAAVGAAWIVDAFVL